MHPTREMVSKRNVNFPVLERHARSVCGLEISALYTWDTTEPALYTAEKYDEPGPASIMRALLRMPAFSDEPLWLHGAGTPWLHGGRTESTRSLKDDPNTALRFCARKASRLVLIELHHDDVLDSLPNAVDSPIYATA